MLACPCERSNSLVGRAGKRFSALAALLVMSLATLPILAEAQTRRSRPDGPNLLDQLPADDASYRLVTEPARHFVGEFSVVLTPAGVVKDWCIMAAKPPELPSQTGVEVETTPGGDVIRESSPEHREVVRSVFTAERGEEYEVTVRQTYKATLHRRRLEVRSPDEPPPPEPKQAIRLKADQANLYTRSDAAYDFRKPAFRAWLKQNELELGPDEGKIHFARRVYLAIKRDFIYDSGNPVASEMVVCRRGECGSMAIVFVSALRANRIPARALGGRWAMSAPPNQNLNGNPYYQIHVKAEFFVEEVGWIPCDPNGGLQFDRTNLGFDNFGDDRGDFFCQNVDFNLQVPTVIGGKRTLFLMQNPSYVVRLQPNAEPTQLPTATTRDQVWQVEVEPIDTQRRREPTSSGKRTSPLP